MVYHILHSYQQFELPGFMINYADDTSVVNLVNTRVELELKIRRS